MNPVSTPRRLLTRADVARLKGVSRAAITKQCNRGCLAPACADDRVDIDHPAAKKYLGDKWPKPITARPKTTKAQPAPKRPATPTTGRPTPPKQSDPNSGGDLIPEPDGPDDIESVKHLTLEELVHRHGTVRPFADWLAALKKIEDIREKRLSNEETEGRLIERELVKTHVFGAIDGMSKRLLTDAPKTVARKLFAAAKAGGSIEEAETSVREVVASLLRPVKATAARVLKNA